MQLLRDYEWLSVDTLPGCGAVDGVVIRSDLEPLTDLGSRLRAVFDDDVWNALRRPVCEAAGNRCEVCGIPTVVGGKEYRPDTHEQWAYEFRNGVRPVQRLVRLVALCKACHRLQHVTASVRRSTTRHSVIERLCSLNGWTRDEVTADLAWSLDRWRFLDRFAWDMDLTALAGRVELPDYPGLVIPYADRARLVDITKAAREQRRLMRRQVG